MAAHAEPSLEEHLWTIAVARLLLPGDVAVQAPPNLAYDDFPRLLDAGIDDWGGVSPVTIDHVNPEAPWPDLVRLGRATRSRLVDLAPRLPIYPAMSTSTGSTSECRCTCSAPPDAQWARARGHVASGEAGFTPFVVEHDVLPLDTATELGEAELVRLFRARGEERQRVRSRPPTGFGARSAATRSATSSRATSSTRTSATSAAVFVPSRKGSWLRTCAARAVPRPARGDRPSRPRGLGAGRDRGLPPGRNPSGFTGEYYASVVAAIRAELPELHIHAFSALEARRARRRSASISAPTWSCCAWRASARSLDGGRDLDDEVRAVICPDKISTEQWLAVHDAAHGVGLRSNVTIMFGHVERPGALGEASPAGARAAAAVGRIHRVRPAPVRAHGGADVVAGRARSGLTFGESLLLHAVSGWRCTW